MSSETACTSASACFRLPHHRWNAEQLHDYVLFLGNTGLRPDEAKNLQHRDITIVEEGLGTHLEPGGAPPTSR